MGFLEIIEKIENELKLIYMPGAIQYIDKNFDNAWSKAIDRFDLSLSTTIEAKNFEIAKLEGSIYRDTILKLIDIYKNHIRGNEVIDFFKSIK